MGFMKISGVYFTESFTLVISDVTMRILIMLWVLFCWHAELIYVEGAFLCGFLEPLFMFTFLKG